MALALWYGQHFSTTISSINLGVKEEEPADLTSTTAPSATVPSTTAPSTTVPSTTALSTTSLKKKG